ncbi:ABC transporter permease [Halorubrum gandharaense]
MSLVAVAKKDFQDAIRSRWLIALTVLFALILSTIAYLVRPAPGQDAPATALLSPLDQFVVGTLVPLIALVVGYNAVCGERESGSLKLLLSLPHSRADVVFGKVLGRAAALSTAVVVGLFVPAVVIAAGPFEFEPLVFLGYVLLVCLLATVFVAIAVGLSAFTGSRWVALGGAIGLYFLFVPLWNAIQMPLQFWFMGGGGQWLPLTPEQVFQFLQVFRPNGAFNTLSQSYLAGEFLTGPQQNLQISALAMLVFWTLAPPLVGLLRFERADL